MPPSAAPSAFLRAAALLRGCEAMAVWKFIIDVVSNAIAPLLSWRGLLLLVVVCLIVLALLNR